MKELTLPVTKKQKEFMEAPSDEVLFGGAAGGGKSYGQLIDAFCYALTYPGSKQLILRRTLPELEKTLIRAALTLYPRGLYTYGAAGHTGRFANGSVVDFGYCDAATDVYRYQSAEYDVIRFDELTHFPENTYLYLMSRLRGAKPYPRRMKSTGNPGGPGHGWVKGRFIDPGEPGREIAAEGGTRIFIPARLADNTFLQKSDPGYARRLMNLPEREKRALLYGDWDIFEGQYFAEWDRKIHTCPPFALPAHWRRFVSVDYGLDMLAALWIALEPGGRAWVYREVYKSGLIISDAARAIREGSGREKITATLAPPDLWNRRQETGRSAAEIFRECGVSLVKTPNRREDGWLAVKEWLKPVAAEDGGVTARLRIFGNCVNLIRCLPALLADPKNPNDAAAEPHELTHAPDALRGFCAARVAPGPEADAGGRAFFDPFGLKKRGEKLGRERSRVM